MINYDIASVFVRWSTARAVLHRGYWLVASLYLVLDADLSPAQLVFLGTAQGLTALVCEVPAGAFADTISRRWSLIISQGLMGASMIATASVNSFGALMLTQMLWGLSWTFASGADVAWVVDELNQPEQIDRVLAKAARLQNSGGAFGMIGFGVLAWATQRRFSMILAGTLMCALSLYVVARFTEQRFIPTRQHRWRRSASVLRGGVQLARRDRIIVSILLATFLVNAAAEGSGRLFAKRLIQLGFPAGIDAVLWITALGVITFSIGALGLGIVERRINQTSTARRAYVLSCAAGVFALVLLAAAPGVIPASIGVLIAEGVAFTITRTAAVIWLNSRTPADMRATVHSLLAQAEYLGEIACGIVVGLLAKRATVSATMMVCAAMLVLAIVVIARVGLNTTAPGGTSSADEPTMS